MAKIQTLDGDDLRAAQVRPKSATRQRGVVPSAELVPLQFKMPPEFIWAFKRGAVDNHMKLNEFLKACFDAFMKSGKKTA
jgi:hypothetical protein